MSPDLAALRSRLLTEDDWGLWRDLRLRALAESPHAYGSTLEREQAFTEADWRLRAGGAANAVALGAGTAGPWVVAFAGEIPVGMGAGYRDLPGWLHVVAMWTDPAWRGQGVGRLVIQTLQAWAADRRLQLHLDVTIGNGAARVVYERCGFVATEETRPLREGSPYRCRRMVLPAGVTPA